jgi:hypothetical protein
MRALVSIHINKSIRRSRPGCQMELEAEIPRQPRGEAWRGRESFCPSRVEKTKELTGRLASGLVLDVEVGGGVRHGCG